MNSPPPRAEALCSLLERVPIKQDWRPAPPQPIYDFEMKRDLVLVISQVSQHAFWRGTGPFAMRYGLFLSFFLLSDTSCSPHGGAPYRRPHSPQYPPLPLASLPVRGPHEGLTRSVSPRPCL
jgi:hypothetical protein